MGGPWYLGVTVGPQPCRDSTQMKKEQASLPQSLPESSCMRVWGGRGGWGHAGPSILLGVVGRAERTRRGYSLAQ